METTMTPIVYFDQPNTNMPHLDWYKMDGVKNYLKHLDNYLYLQFIKSHKDTSPAEKSQAIKEIAIANRKCDFWFKISKSQQRLPELRKQELEKIAVWREKGIYIPLKKR